MPNKKQTDKPLKTKEINPAKRDKKGGIKPTAKGGGKNRTTKIPIKNNSVNH